MTSSVHGRPASFVKDAWATHATDGSAHEASLSPADYAVLVFYFVFMASMGWVFKRFIKDTSDYFRSGGEMLWWIVGAGAFMTNFSAVSFTGMAGKAYDDGPLVLVIFFGGALGFFFNYIYFAPVFRQMRCVTAMDAVRKRFGAANEQFFTWIQIPTGMLYAAIWLNGLAVFLSAAFRLPSFALPMVGEVSGMNLTIIITAAGVLCLTLLGGSWSTTASDFVQMLLLMPVTVVTSVLALMKVGGIGNFVARVPRHFWHWGEVANSNILLVWVIAMLVQKWIVINNMTDASRYLSVKDTKHAKKAALLCMILFIVGPAVWFIPPMVARILYPDLHAVFPPDTKAQEPAGRLVLRDRADDDARRHARPAHQRHLRLDDGADGLGAQPQRRLLHQELLPDRLAAQGERDGAPAGVQGVHRRVRDGHRADQPVVREHGPPDDLRADGELRNDGGAADQHPADLGHVRPPRTLVGGVELRADRAARVVSHAGIPRRQGPGRHARLDAQRARGDRVEPGRQRADQRAFVGSAWFLVTPLLGRRASDGS
jgi:hypothetical protein